MCVHTHTQTVIIRRKGGDRGDVKTLRGDLGVAQPTYWSGKPEAKDLSKVAWQREGS